MIEEMTDDDLMMEVWKRGYACIKKGELTEKNNLIKKQQVEIHELKEKLQMFIPRRRLRRIYKMIGKILRTDIDPIILEKELKAEYKIPEEK